MSIYGEASDGLSGDLGAPGAGPKAEVKNPLKGCTDPAMAWYGSLPADQQKKVKIGGGVGLVVLVGLLFYANSGPSPSDMVWGVDPGQYEAGDTPMSFTEAQAYCEGKGYHLASIHSKEEQAEAATACALQEIGTHWGDTEHPNGCWIGLHVGEQGDGVFQWTDGSLVDYLNFYSGEPNQCSSADLWDQNHCGHAGEKYVELQSNWGFAWNDNGLEGSYTHDVETQAARQADLDASGNGGTATNSARGMYPLCLKRASIETALEGSLEHGRAATTWRLPKPSCRADGIDGLHHVREAVKNPNTGKWDCQEETGVGENGVPVSLGKPNFILLPYTSSATQAESLCKDKGYAGLASLHNIGDVRHAKELCGNFAMQHTVIKGLPHSCWIGLSDKEQEGGFAWLDQTSVEYLNWSPGEPNEWGGEESGEDYVAMRYDGTRGGAWNDANVLGEAGHAAMGSNGGHTMAQITGCHGCYGPAGYYPLCEERRPHASQNGPWEWQTLTGAESGRFKVLPKSLPLAQAKAACEANGMHGLASIHSRAEQMEASKVCRQVASVDAELQHGIAEGCWIGLTDADPAVGEGTFKWTDNSPVNFLNWNSGEPNECVGCGGEDGVEIDYRWGSRNGYEFGGGWNDANDFGRAGSSADNRATQATHDQCWGCWGAVGYFPLCQTQPPGSTEGPPTWSTPTKAGTCVSSASSSRITWTGGPGSNQYVCPMQPGYAQQPSPHTSQCQSQTFVQYRFLIEAVRGEGAGEAGGSSTHAANSVQIAEFNFYAGPGKTSKLDCNFAAGCRVTNPGGDNPNRLDNVCEYDQTSQQQTNCVQTDGLGSELPPMVVDNNIETKWLDFGMVRDGNNGRQEGSQLVFSNPQRPGQPLFTQPDGSPQPVVGYSFVTANDAPERDPSSWRFQGCAREPCDNQWINLDIRRSYSAPTSRNWETHEFAVSCAGAATQTQCVDDTNAADQGTGCCQPCTGTLFGQNTPAGCQPYCAGQTGQAGQCSSTGATCQGAVDHHQRALIALPKPESWDSARLLCKRTLGPHADLASIHSPSQQAAAVETCSQLTAGETLEGGIPHSCWIGLNDVEGTLDVGSIGESYFSWTDSSPVDYIEFSPGEPNNVGDNGEDVTEIDVRQGRTGGWNDNHNLGEAGNGDDMAGCYGCFGTFGNYPLCETHAPAATAVEHGQASSSNVYNQQTCWIDQSQAYVPGTVSVSGKGCRGTYNECCRPIPRPGDTVGCGGVNPPAYCAGGGGRRALAEATSANDNATSVTAHPTRVVHTINETKWVSTEEFSASDFAVMADLSKTFGDKVYTWGCTASNALNYNPEATMEAGTCEYHPDQPGYTRWY